MLAKHSRKMLPNLEGRKVVRNEKKDQRRGGKEEGSLNYYFIEVIVQKKQILVLSENSLSYRREIKKIFSFLYLREFLISTKICYF